MPRNPFDFLDSATRERVLLHLLLALIKKNNGEIELSLADLTAIQDGDGFIKQPSDTDSSLVLRFARRGAEVYFLSDSEPSRRPSKTVIVQQPDPDQPLLPYPPARRAVHSEMDLALMEEERAAKAAAAAKNRLNEARAQAGSLPWRTAVKPQ
jgi:hypothetical protein